MSVPRVARLHGLQKLQCRTLSIRTARAGLQSSDRIHKRWSTYSSRQKVKGPTLDSYYDDLLNTPRKELAPKTRTAPAPPPKDELPKTDKEEKISKARVIFGSRLAGPQQRRQELDRASQRIAGILVPPRPEEPDNCCMSGCVNCVWERYRDELEEWAERSAQARAALTQQRQQEAKARSGDGTTDVLGRTARQGSDMPQHVANSMDDDGGGSETNWDPAISDTQGDIFAGIPVGIREFMRTEKRLKKDKQKKAAAA